MESVLPLVSVGIPTYNRPDYLRRVLDCMLAQTYPNLEILVSDNASPDPEVERVGRDYKRRDARICYFRQKENRGVVFNFKFVLEQASGRYFMWASDDDFWEPFYIATLVNELESLGVNYVAATFEAQYMDENYARFEFFSEAAPFYNFQSDIVMKRLKQTLTYNYGNLFYSLYRKEVLDRLDLIYHNNEISFLLQIAEQGNWRVLPQVGFLKMTTLSTYQKARWEKVGGFLTRRSLKSAGVSLQYHRRAFNQIRLAIQGLNLSKAEQNSLVFLTSRLLINHWFFLLIGYKPKLFS